MARNTEKQVRHTGHYAHSLELRSCYRIAPLSVWRMVDTAILKPTWILILYPLDTALLEPLLVTARVRGALTLADECVSLFNKIFNRLIHLR